MWSYDFKQKGKTNKNIIDAVGVKKVKKKLPKKGYEYYYDVQGIEAKASLSDFKNGFCAAPALTYIISPKGVIPVELIPEKIGLIEVDLDNFKIRQWINKVNSIKGVEIVKPVKRRLDSRFKTKEDYRKWCEEILESVAYRSTVELLFWRNVIELSK